MDAQDAVAVVQGGYAHLTPELFAVKALPQMVLHPGAVDEYMKQSISIQTHFIHKN